ncbi:MAG: hypothetical protein ABFS18_13730 [Thermodesulfobacteriota bacterium]
MKDETSIDDRRRHYLFIGIVAIVMIVAMSYSYYSSNRMINRYAPLVDAAMEVKLEATTAHLWFEEIISGDRHENIEEVMEHIDQSDWYARAMLEGGQNPEGTFLPLSDLALRKEVAMTIEYLNEFREITVERYKSFKSAEVGSAIDHLLYDGLFNNLLAQTDNVETLLQQKIKEDYNRYSSIQIALIIVVVILSFLGFFVQNRYDRRQKKNLFEISQAFERFNTVMNSLEAIIYVADMDTYEILFLNNYGKKLFGDVEGKICWQNLQKGQTGPCDFCTNKHLLDTKGEPGDAFIWEFQNSVTGKYFHIVDKAITWTKNRIVRLEIATDISGRKEAEVAREALIEKLERALDEIKKLRGILPICAFCKNIRNDEGYYEQIEEYLHNHSGVDFSHTICPKCAKKHYPEEYEKIISKKQ